MRILRHSLEELESVDVGLNPGREILREGGLREGIIAGPQGGHEDVGRVDLSGLGIGDLQGLAGIVNGELLSGPIFLAQARIELFSPLMVETAKLTILVALGELLLVFVPEKLKGDALLL
jgi:hypothetical protein